MNLLKPATITQTTIDCAVNYVTDILDNDKVTKGNIDKMNVAYNKSFRQHGSTFHNLFLKDIIKKVSNELGNFHVPKERRTVSELCKLVISSKVN